MASEQLLIGRKKEISILQKIYNSRKSEFVIIYGRRRVGKTYLVNHVFDGKFVFRITGLGNAGTLQQLANFHAALIDLDPSLEGQILPENWFNTFRSFTKVLEKNTSSRKLIFIDELPWFDTPGSDFLSSLEHFWNSWASLRQDIVLITCGSAASWMINKLIFNRGGLHNRVTERIQLQPFSLSETEAFLKAKGAVYDRYQILELYMSIGGIPFYLDTIQTNRSVAQNIDRLFFETGGLLNLEYQSLYRSLFNKYEKHTSIVEALAQKTQGLDRKTLLKLSNLADGGSSSEILDELIYSGFISKSVPFGKNKRDAVYRLSDPYSLFYLTFVRDSKAKGEGSWLAQLKSPKWRAWSGYAFEFICLHHVDQIKKHLGISGVYTEASPWKSKGLTDNVQIDLLLDRKDRIINICEMKFHEEKFTLSKVYADKLAQKISVFRQESGTNKTILLTLISTFGHTMNEYSLRYIQESLDMNALFD